MTVWGHERSGGSLLRDLERENRLRSERDGRVGEKGVLLLGDCCSKDCWGGDCWDCFDDCCCGRACSGGLVKCILWVYEFLFLFLWLGWAVCRIFGFCFPTVPAPLKVHGSVHFLRLFSIWTFLFSFFPSFLLGDEADVDLVVLLLLFLLLVCPLAFLLLLLLLSWLWLLLVFWQLLLLLAVVVVLILLLNLLLLLLLLSCYWFSFSW